FAAQSSGERPSPRRHLKIDRINAEAADMAETEEIHYTKEAFLNGYNIAFLVAAGALGIFNWDLVPLITGIALPLEGLYLLPIPGQAGFRRGIGLKRALEGKEALEKEKSQLIRSFPNFIRDRYERLRSLKADIAQKCSSKGT